MNFGSGGTMSILYDQTGKKLRKTIPTYTQDYVDGLEYRTNSGGGTLTLEAIYHQEGRITPFGASYQYEYNIKDHLGNTRLIFTDLNANGVVDVPSDILQENHYYPFGLKMNYTWMDNLALDNKYQFNGIERNEDLGLNLDLAMFRGYDPAVGRWWQVDPKPSFLLSGYSGFGNNPILFADHFGDTTTVYTTHGVYVGTINDQRANQQHFVSLKRKAIEGQKSLIQEANKSAESADKAAGIVRGGSKYFIGANTRNDLSKISSASAAENKERLFVLSYTSKNKELRATDISSKTTYRASNSISGGGDAIKNFMKSNPRSVVIGWGHTHPAERNESDSNYSMGGLHNPSFPADCNNFNIINPVEGGVGNNPSIILTRYGYLIYTTFSPTETKADYEGAISPAVYNFSGQTIYDNDPDRP